MEFPDERPPPNMRGRRAVYRPNRKSFGAFIRSGQMRDVTTEVAQDIAQETGARSTRSNGPGPHMADQWQVKPDAGFVKVSGNVRVKVEVFNPDIAAAAQEYGAGPREGQRRRTLGKVAAEFGDFKIHGDES
jgi:hypothetical protein